MIQGALPPLLEILLQLDPYLLHSVLGSTTLVQPRQKLSPCLAVAVVPCGNRCVVEEALCNSMLPLKHHQAIAAAAVDAAVAGRNDTPVAVAAVAREARHTAGQYSSPCSLNNEAWAVVDKERTATNNEMLE